MDNEETTELNHKDPDVSGFHVPGHNLVLRPIHIEGKTKGGIILADKTQHDIAYLMNVCKVLKIGKTAYTQEMFKDTGPWCKVGDYVLIPRISGQKIKWQGTPLTLLGCDKILAVLDNPRDIDPNFNLGVGSSW
jgi:co-chaperonin GroES (HSP10)